MINTKMLTTWTTTVCTAILLTSQSAHAAGPNLVPPPRKDTASYWCTWYAQNYWIGRGTDLHDLKGVSNQAAREELNEHTIFNENDGWATTCLDGARQDFIFLIDHGWQTKDASKRIGGGPAFFNLVAEESDFPRYAGLSPQDVLLQFNNDIQSLGWNSLGIWTRGDVTLDQAKTFVEWSKHAGITYWKIDGGDTNEFNSFQAKQQIYPELILEYVTGAGGNINPKWDQDLESYPSVYEIGGRLQEPMLKCLKHADTFRTYDATPLLMSATTLRRTHDILKQTQQQPEYRAILNVQDDCNIAIGLGVLVASKRHPNINERTLKGRDLHHQLSGKRRMQRRMNEVERLGRWARIAPAFPAGEGVYLASDNELIDRCEFTQWDTWASNTYGRMVSQSAPAIMARNMPLPIVECEGDLPYVCVCTYPNGPTGIATEGRVSPDDHWFHPRAKVIVQVKDASEPFGIAGHYDQLVLNFAGNLDAVKHVWAQDLLADESIDIKNQVSIQGARMIIDGQLIDTLGTAAGDDGDQSVPGLVVRLEGDSLPVAGDEFTPVTEPVKTAKPAKTSLVMQQDGYFGSATLDRCRYGYRVVATGPEQVVLKELDESITSGRVSVDWKMKPANRTSTKNGLLVLSSDEDANAALCAGSWIGAKEITLFENHPKWGKDLRKSFTHDRELDCRLDVDLDLRTARLTINGESINLAFSETVTSINYIGFGVHNAGTLFTVPTVTRH
ncbi:hypothetical protein [Aporhodopirellula aestuarii]|uniref:Uncharacterized protein n=1 Tax=Aporhodopirellula aestuarii TaxID=2950107 RepID=A0ABT0UEU0_9BACT|nr:hypothetical protein [Aporhodopirellula aestuarii]MCM2375286.1 hypothetical protein [Aporhodopirellula aestuarii]